MKSDDVGWSEVPCVLVPPQGPLNRYEPRAFYSQIESIKYVRMNHHFLLISLKKVLAGKLLRREPENYNRYKTGTIFSLKTTIQVQVLGSHSNSCLSIFVRIEIQSSFIYLHCVALKMEDREYQKSSGKNVCVLLPLRYCYDGAREFCLRLFSTFIFCLSVQLNQATSS